MKVFGICANCGGAHPLRYKIGRKGEIKIILSCCGEVKGHMILPNMRYLDKLRWVQRMNRGG